MEKTDLTVYPMHWIDNHPLPVKALKAVVSPWNHPLPVKSTESADEISHCLSKHWRQQWANEITHCLPRPM